MELNSSEFWKKEAKDVIFIKCRFSTWKEFKTLGARKNKLLFCVRYFNIYLKHKRKVISERLLI